MYRAIIPILLLAGVTTAGVSQVDRSAPENPKLTKQLAGMMPGKPQDCITPSRSLGSDRYGDVTLIKDRQGTLYLSRFQGGCSANSSDALISRRPTERLCRGDIVESRDLVNGITSGSCIYGDFVPYTRQ